METEQDKPIDREAWRRLLEDGGEPPALTDARIRAAARRALPPRTQRWWLPASLAASLLLAVLIVQWQFGDQRAPAVVTESDVAAQTPEATHPRQDLPAPERAKERAVPQTAPAESAPAYIEMTPMNLPPPQVDAPAMEDRASSRETSADESREATRDAAAAPSPTGVTAAPQEARAERDVAALGRLQKSGELLRSPEDWYAEIERLRAAGHDEEAERELENLEAAYPGWLEENHPADR